MSKFQNELRAAITECYRMKPIHNNESVKLWKEQHEDARQKLEALIERCVDKDSVIDGEKVIYKHKCGHCLRFSPLPFGVHIELAIKE